MSSSVARRHKDRRKSCALGLSNSEGWTVESSPSSTDSKAGLGKQDSPTPPGGRIIDVGEWSAECFVPTKEYEIEIDYRPSAIPMENGLAVTLTDPEHDPLRLGYLDAEDVIEVIGWGLRLSVAERHDLSEFIARRIHQLLAGAIAGRLNEQDEACLDLVSRQIDYRSYLAQRSRPKYREATLVRKQPVIHLQFLSEKLVKLGSRFADALRLLREGDRFGAWFTTDAQGEIQAIEAPSILWEQDFPAEWENPAPEPVSEGLRAMFPKLKDKTE